MLTSFADGQSIHTWYDHQTRIWITQLKDYEGNQIGNAEFSPNKKFANITHKFFCSIIKIVDDPFYEETGNALAKMLEKGIELEYFDSNSNSKIKETIKSKML